MCAIRLEPLTHLSVQLFGKKHYEELFLDLMKNNAE